MNKVLTKSTCTATLAGLTNAAAVLLVTTPPRVVCDPSTWPDITGAATGLQGIFTGIRGNIGNITGVLHEALVGDVSNLTGDISGLTGNCSGLSGDATGVVGNASGLSGNLDTAGLSAANRQQGVSISFLTL